MKNYRYRIKDLLIKNPFHTIIVLCGFRLSEKWRQHLKHTMLKCDLAAERESREQFERSYEQEMHTLAFILKCVSAETFGQGPVVGAVWRCLIARIDWQEIATRLMEDALYELCMFGDLPS